MLNKSLTGLRQLNLSLVQLNIETFTEQTAALPHRQPQQSTMLRLACLDLILRHQYVNPALLLSMVDP